MAFLSNLQKVRNEAEMALKTLSHDMHWLVHIFGEDMFLLDI